MFSAQLPCLVDRISNFNTQGLIGTVLDALTINNSITVPHSHNIPDRDSSDSSTTRTTNQVGATHFSAFQGRAMVLEFGFRTILMTLLLSLLGLGSAFHKHI
jgi:hypothetical protein